MREEHKEWSDDTVDDDRDATRRPFATFDLDKLPRPRADDPPYRPWWVISDSQGR